MNSDKLNIEEKYYQNNNIIIKKDEINEEQKLLNILTNKNLFNDKKTKIIIKKEYEFLITLLNNANYNEFINLFKYINNIKIPIIKILIMGYIEFNIDNENIALEIISKGINICFNKNIFCFVYTKLSKQFRKHYLIKDIQTIKKFEKLFNVWKLLYNITKPIYDIDLINTSYFIFFFFFIRKKKFCMILIKLNLIFL